MKSQEENKKDMLEVLEKLTTLVKNDKITDLVVLGYKSRKVCGGIFADQITSVGLIKALERDLSAEIDTPTVNAGFKQFLDDLLSEDDE